MIKDAISPRLNRQLEAERNARYEAKRAAYDAAALTKAERKRAVEAESAISYLSPPSATSVLGKRLRAIEERFGTIDLNYLYRKRGAHPQVRKAVATALEAAGLDGSYAEALERIVQAEGALVSVTKGPLLKHAKKLDRLFGTRDLVEARGDQWRYLH